MGVIWYAIVGLIYISLKAYDAEVKSQAFPAAEHNFAIDSEVIAEVEKQINTKEFTVNIDSNKVLA